MSTVCEPNQPEGMPKKKQSFMAQNRTELNINRVSSEANHEIIAQSVGQTVKELQVQQKQVAKAKSVVEQDHFELILEADL